MNELMTLVFSLIGFGLMIVFAQKESIPHFPLVVTAYCFFVASNTFTVVEDYWLFSLFNVLEHISYLGCGVCALLAALRYTR